MFECCQKEYEKLVGLDCTFKIQVNRERVKVTWRDSAGKILASSKDQPSTIDDIIHDITIDAAQKLSVQ